MCTIYTFDKMTFETHKVAIINQIKADFVNNPHGCSLVLLGKNPDQSVFLQSMTLEDSGILTMLESLQNWDRFFLHLRHSTTNARNLAGCHGFRSGDTNWLVMHNGIISGACSRFRVDSMAIAAHLEATGSAETTANWITTLSYANVFLINTETGEWYVSRGDAQGGTLHCDKDATVFSTKPIDGITTDFIWHDASYKKFDSAFEKPIVKSYGHHHFGTRHWNSSYYRSVWDDDDDSDVITTDIATTAAADAYTSEEINIIIELIKASTKDEIEFLVLCEDEDWKDLFDIPWEIRKYLTANQRRWLLAYSKQVAKDKIILGR